jgi:hypothetical protein
VCKSASFPTAQTPGQTKLKLLVTKILRLAQDAVNNNFLAFRRRERPDFLALLFKPARAKVG